VRPTVFREPSGRACNSYELWREDVDLVAGLGLDTYRFSVEWARVEPVEGAFSAEALEHYRAVVDHCVAAGIAPVVTYNHFTSPHWFAGAAGGSTPGLPTSSPGTSLAARTGSCPTTRTHGWPRSVRSGTPRAASLPT
jgi:beta-glucosidase